LHLQGIFDLCRRLEVAGPKEATGPVTTAGFADTCGNLIMLHQK
jgi:hypothetical protein